MADESIAARAAAVTVDSVDPLAAEAVAAVSAYLAELDARFPGGFQLGEGAATADAESLRPPHGVFLLARVDDAVVGCGGLRTLGAEVAEVKRMWVDPNWRGLGLGRRLLARLEEAARGTGHRRVRLDTASELSEAIALYSAAGYHETARYNDNPYAKHWFEKVL